MELPRFLSSSDVPHRFLKAAGLVGSIPSKVLQIDPRVSYSVYIPPDHYNPDPNFKNPNNQKDLSPAYQLPLLPLVVTIHSTNRESNLCRNRLIPFANSDRVAVLAPLFPAGIDSFSDTENYKMLRYKSLHADTSLFDMLEEVKARWPGVDTEKVFMVGFSGGAQFVQRFLYLYPEKLHAVSIASPGRVTSLDEGLKWPEGIRDVAEVFGERAIIKKSNIAAVNIQLVVGGADTEVHGGPEFWEWLAKVQELQKETGQPGSGSKRGKLNKMVEGRVATLTRLKSEWESEGILSQFVVVEGIKHEGDKLFPTVVDFLRPLVHQ